MSLKIVSLLRCSCLSELHFCEGVSASLNDLCSTSVEFTLFDFYKNFIMFLLGGGVGDKSQILKVLISFLNFVHYQT